MANSYFGQIAIKKSGILSRPLVDAITNASPVVDTLPVRPSSHGLWNLSPVLDNVTGAAFAEFGAELQTMSANLDTRRIDLKTIGGEYFCPEDMAIQYGGIENYFATVLPSMLRASANTLEADILTNSFRAYAIANSNIVKAGTGSSGFSSIIAVTYTEGEVEGLYDMNSWNAGNVFTVTNLYNGALSKNPTTKVNGFYQQIKSIFGINLVNPKKVSAYVNINASQLPTATGMDELLERCEYGTGMMTVLYMNPRVYTYLKNLKNVLMTDGTGLDDVFKRFKSFDGCPIITTFNLPKLTETIVS